MHLKYSKGSRHWRQRCSALQGVEPNWLMHSVSTELQRGQAIGRSPATPAVPRKRPLRRHDAVRGKLASSLSGDPVAAPGGREHAAVTANSPDRGCRERLLAPTAG